MRDVSDDLKVHQVSMLPSNVLVNGRPLLAGPFHLELDRGQSLEIMPKKLKNIFFPETRPL